ncbi:hypothetical protein [Ruminococcus sp.]
MTIHEVKKSLGRRVSYNGSDCYELTGCIIRKSSKTGQFFYQAEIADKTSERYKRLNSYLDYHGELTTRKVDYDDSQMSL